MAEDLKKLVEKGISKGYSLEKIQSDFANAGWGEAYLNNIPVYYNEFKKKSPVGAKDAGVLPSALETGRSSLGLTQVGVDSDSRRKTLESFITEASAFERGVEKNFTKDGKRIPVSAEYINSNIPKLSNAYKLYQAQNPNAPSFYDEDGKPSREAFDYIRRDYDAQVKADNQKKVEKLKKEANSPLATLVLDGAYMLAGATASFLDMFDKNLSDWWDWTKTGDVTAAIKPKKREPAVLSTFADEAFENWKNKITGAKLNDGLTVEEIQDGAIGNAQKGNYRKAATLLGWNIAEALPLYASMVLTKKPFTTAFTVGAGSAFQEVKDDDAFNDLEKFVYAMGVGGVELATEKLFPSDIVAGKNAGKQMWNFLTKSAGKESVEQMSKKELGDILFGKIPGLGKETIARAGVEEGFEEALAGGVQQALGNWLGDKPYNLRDIGEQAITGLGFGSSIKVATKGTSALLQAANVKDVISIKNRINQINTLLDDETISTEEKSLLSNQLNRFKTDLRKMQDSASEYYKGFSKEDVDQTIKLNQQIDNGLNTVKSLKTPEAKMALVQEIKGALEQKAQIEQKYDSTQKQQVPSAVVQGAQPGGVPIQGTSAEAPQAGGVLQVPSQQEEEIASKTQVIENSSPAFAFKPVSVTLTESNAPEVIGNITTYVDTIPDELFKTLSTSRQEVMNGVESIANVISSLSKSGRQVPVTVYATEDAWKRGTGQPLSRGIYVESEVEGQPSSISVFLPALVGNTVYHEGLHDVVPKVFGTQGIETVAKRLSQAVKQDPLLAAQLGQFVSNYEQSDKAEEFLAELGSRVSAGDIDIEVTKSLATRFMEAVASVLGAVGIKMSPNASQLSRAFLEYAQKLGAGVELGEIENMLEGNTEAGPVAPAQKIKKPTKYQDIIQAKDSYGLSYVNPSNVIDIEQLIDEIVSQGKTVLFWAGDQLGVGEYIDPFTKKKYNLQGGPSYMLDPENVKRGAVWASNIEVGTLNDIILKKRPDYVFIVSGEKTSMMFFNKTVGNIWIDRAQSKFKNIDSFKKAFGKVTKGVEYKTIAEYKSWDELRSQLETEVTSKADTREVNKAKSLIKAIAGMSTASSLAFLKSYGLQIKQFDDLRDGYFRENDFDMLDITTIYKPREIIEGNSNHLSYRNVIMGEAVGVPNRKLSAKDIMTEEFMLGLTKEGLVRNTLPDSMLVKAIAPDTPAVRGVARLSRKLPKAQRMTESSEKLEKLFRRDGIALTKEEAAEILKEVDSWRDWYDGISSLVEEVFGEYAADYMMFMFGSAMAANSASTIGGSINNLDRFYKEKELTGLPLVKQNIYRSMLGLEVNSRKIQQFINAGLGDKNAKPIDMHVWSFMNSFSKTKSPNEVQFKKGLDFVDDVAEVLGWDPREVQATMWAANILRLGGKPDTYEEYIRRKVDKGLNKTIQGWRNKGIKPVFKVVKDGERLRTEYAKEIDREALEGNLKDVNQRIAQIMEERKVKAKKASPRKVMRMALEGYNEKPQAMAGQRLFNEPLIEAAAIADEYYEKEFNEARPKFNGIKSVDKERAKKISDAYVRMEDNYFDPEVKKAYDAMIDETLKQFDFIVDRGYKVVINNEEPYKNSEDMITDLRDNKVMRIFSTESGFGDNPITENQRDSNPLLKDSGKKDANGIPLLNNDLFRFVHDFFGHAELGNGFGAVGEENAWNVHARMYSPLARKAMTSETRGQNSYVNFSGINEEVFKIRDKAREERKKGNDAEADKLLDEVYNKMKFADQKVGLLPEEMAIPDGFEDTKPKPKAKRMAIDETFKNAAAPSFITEEDRREFQSMSLSDTQDEANDELWAFVQRRNFNEEQVEEVLQSELWDEVSDSVKQNEEKREEEAYYEKNPHEKQLEEFSDKMEAYEDFDFAVERAGTGTSYVTISKLSFDKNGKRSKEDVAQIRFANHMRAYNPKNPDIANYDIGPDYNTTVDGVIKRIVGDAKPKVKRMAITPSESRETPSQIDAMAGELLLDLFKGTKYFDRVKSIKRQLLIDPESRDKYKKALGEKDGRALYGILGNQDAEKAIAFAKEKFPIKGSLAAMADRVYLPDSDGEVVTFGSTVIYGEYQKYLNRELKNIVNESKLDPKDLLREVGYELFNPKNLTEARESFLHFYENGQNICTLSIGSNRFQESFVTFIVKDDAAITPMADKLTQDNLTKDWKDYLEKKGRKNADGTYNLNGIGRDSLDPYSTSVVSLQINKSNGVVKEISRYNHQIGSPDNIFSRDFNKIIDGLEDAMFKKFGVNKNIKQSKKKIPYGIIQDTDGRFFNYIFEKNGVYYGDGFYLEGGVATRLDNGSQRMVDGFVVNANGKVEDITNSGKPFFYGDVLKVNYIKGNEISLKTVNGDFVFEVKNGAVLNLINFPKAWVEKELDKISSYTYDSEGGIVIRNTRYSVDFLEHINMLWSNDIVGFETSMDFSNTKIQSLGKLKYITGNANFWKSNIKSLGELMYIGGSAYFSKSQVQSLGELRYIGSMATFLESQIQSLEKLRYVGSDIEFAGSIVKSLGELRFVAGYASFFEARVQSLGKLRYVGSSIDTYDVQSLGELKYVGKNASFPQIQDKSFEELRYVGGYIYLGNLSRIESLGNLSHVGRETLYSSAPNNIQRKINNIVNSRESLGYGLIGKEEYARVRAEYHQISKKTEELVRGLNQGFKPNSSSTIEKAILEIDKIGDTKPEVKLQKIAKAQGSQLDAQVYSYLLSISEKQPDNTYKLPFTLDDFLSYMVPAFSRQRATEIYENVSKGITPEKVVKSVPNIDDAYEASKKLLDSQKNKKMFTWDAARKFFLDRQATLKAAILKAGMKNAYNLLVNRAGSGARANYFFSKQEKAIYDGLSSKDIEALDKIIMLRRIAEIDKNFDVRGEKRPIHPNKLNFESAQIGLAEKRKELGDAKFNELNDKANKYFDAFKSLLDSMYDEGLINEDLYNRLKNLDYQPRMFIEHVFDMDELSMRDINLSANQVKRIKDGSEDEIMFDSRFLLAVYSKSTFSRIARNKVNRAIAEATSVKGNEEWISKDPKKQFSEVTYFEDGVRKQFYIKSSLKGELDDVQRFGVIPPESQKYVGLLSGSYLLKLLATRANPLFVFRNIPRDYLHVLFFTNVYDNMNMPLAMYRLAGDAIKGVKGKIKDDQDYKDFIEYGGGMEYLSTEGKEGMMTNRSLLNRTIEKLGSAGELSEIAFRLGMYKRLVQESLKNFNGTPTEEQLAQIKVEAVTKSREMIDFAQGGVATKTLESAVPYINAAFQGFRVSSAYIKNNPKEFVIKLGQLAIGLAVIAMYNAVMGDDDMEDIPEDVKRKYFIIMTPFTEEKDGKTVKKYIKIAKTQQLIPFISSLDMSLEGNLIAPFMGREPRFNEDTIKQSWDAFLSYFPKDPSKPLDEALSSVPLFSALAAYKMNYDTYRKRIVSTDYQDKNVLPAYEDFSDKNVPYFYKAIGQAVDAGPKRLQVATEKFITTPYSSLITMGGYTLMDAIASNVYEVKGPGGYTPAEQEAISNKALKSAGINVEKVFIGTTDPNHKIYNKREQIERINLEASTERKGLKLQAKELGGKYFTAKEQGDAKGMNEALEAIKNARIEVRNKAVEDKNKQDYDYFNDALKTNMRFGPTFPQEYNDITFATDNEARAKIIAIRDMNMTQKELIDYLVDYKRKTGKSIDIRTIIREYDKFVTNEKK